MSGTSECGNGCNTVNIGSIIDHTMLKPDATAEQIKKLCREAVEYKFASVCVNPAYVRLAAGMLRGSGVKACCVIGFPLGASTASIKAAEARDAIENGAEEIDMVVNVGFLKSGDTGAVEDEIKAVVNNAKNRALVKVIIETSLLTDEEKIIACKLAKSAGADFVKTSTGFSTGGATVGDVALMRRTVGPGMGVKASGGIRDFETASKMIEAGANRIGTSASVAIVKNAR